MRNLKFYAMTVIMATTLGGIARANAGADGADIGKGTLDGQSSTISQGSALPAHDLIGYCDRALGILIRAKQIAREQFADGDLTGARQSLTQGLVEAVASFGALNPNDFPLTQLAVARGLDLNSVFQNGCTAGNSQCQSLEDRTALFFMGKYYDYVLRVVADLDRGYYIPYVTQYRRCPSYSCLPPSFGRDFFTAYADSARALLNFYNGDVPNSGLPDALAKDVYELGVAERILGWASADLDSDLFRRHFACLIFDLSSASLDIAKFNAGDRQRFKTSYRAVMFARGVSESAAQELKFKQSCVTYPVWP